MSFAFVDSQCIVAFVRTSTSRYSTCVSRGSVATMSCLRMTSEVSSTKLSGEPFVAYLTDDSQADPR